MKIPIWIEERKDAGGYSANDRLRTRPDQSYSPVTRPYRARTHSYNRKTWSMTGLAANSKHVRGWQVAACTEKTHSRHPRVTHMPRYRQALSVLNDEARSSF